MEKKVKKGKLVVKLLLTIAVAFIALNAIQLIVISNYTKKEMKMTSEDAYSTMTELFSSQITAKIDEYNAELATYTKNHINRTKDPAQIVAWLRENSDIRPEDFDYVAFIDKEGNFDSDIGSHTNVKDRDYYQAIMVQKKDFYVDNPVTSKTTGKTVLHVCRPVDVSGDRIGFFCAVILIEHLNHIVDSVHVGKTGIGTLYASDHNPIATSGNMDSIQLARNDKVNSARIDALIESFNGKTTVFYEKLPEEMMLIYAPVDHTKWYLTFVMNASEVFATSNATSRLIVTFSIISAFVLLVVIGILINSAMKPLMIVEKAINEIATGNADLTKRIELKGKNNNEIGRVVEGFNNFSEKLQGIVATMKNSKNDLDRSGSDLKASTEDTAASITQIIANIESMGNSISAQSDSVHQTAGAVNEIASNIESLNRMIEGQSASVTQAASAVEEMIGNINSVNNSVSRMATSFNDLERKATEGVQKQEDVNAKILTIASESQALQEANAVISSIANQTNLLAMNAAIEAAHAGEAGKGFSVVADEIRKLSETSAEQTKTIGDQLQKIAVNIEDIVNVSKDAAEAFALVSSGMNDTSNLVQEIKNAMDEQTEGSKQISEALGHMNDSSAQVKNASEEMSEGNKAILEEIRNLQDATTSMKSGMEEMSTGATKINETGAALSGISQQMADAIEDIGAQVDQFKV
ncbi:methyl-accepting chemotaxis protein [Treponema sp.]|uniref:methyl-accepting chemotaxis protein n=1 Tax=Treponema sp. TaxID=166 RepID=UPI00298D7F82|nr:methyl-accepting chemotaxis protein [Treponema sp.]MCQ2240861.1 methyl-accepting chemotaxis protein [Treponema sp.]